MRRLPYICVKNLTKKLQGKIVLSNVNLELEKGKVYGFIGHNGSGKTMLLRAIAGLIVPTKGTVTVDEVVVGRHGRTPKSIGIIIENTGLWEDLSAYENLRFLNNFNKSNKISKEDIYASLNLIGLDPTSKKPFCKFSLGMKQKLCIAQAFVEQPDLIILDEPTNALDEKSILLVRNLILESKKRGATILLASHSTEDIGLLCDKVFRINDGVLEDYDYEK